jgi:hypothetical protein
MTEPPTLRKFVVCIANSQRLYRSITFRGHDSRRARQLSRQFRLRPALYRGQSAPDLHAYVASFRPDRTNCTVQIQYAAGPWKTEANDQVRFQGGVLTQAGHEFHFDHAHSCQGGTAVAHNLTDACIHTHLMAVDHLGKEHPAQRYADAAAQTAHRFVNHFGKQHPANYRSESRREVFSMLDAEFAMPPEQILEQRDDRSSHAKSKPASACDNSRTAILPLDRSKIDTRNTPVSVRFDRIVHQRARRAEG